MSNENSEQDKPQVPLMYRGADNSDEFAQALGRAYDSYRSIDGPNSSNPQFDWSGYYCFRPHEAPPQKTPGYYDEDQGYL